MSIVNEVVSVWFRLFQIEIRK